MPPSVGEGCEGTVDATAAILNYIVLTNVLWDTKGGRDRWIRIGINLVLVFRSSNLKKI